MGKIRLGFQNAAPRGFGKSFASNDFDVGISSKHMSLYFKNQTRVELR